MILGGHVVTCGYYVEILTHLDIKLINQATLLTFLLVPDLTHLSVGTT